MFYYILYSQYVFLVIVSCNVLRSGMIITTQLFKHEMEPSIVEAIENTMISGSVYFIFSQNEEK